VADEVGGPEPVSRQPPAADELSAPVRTPTFIEPPLGEVELVVFERAAGWSGLGGACRGGIPGRLNSWRPAVGADGGHLGQIRMGIPSRFAHETGSVARDPGRACTHRPAPLRRDAV